MDLERVKEGGLERHETALHVAARLGKLGMARALAERCSRYQVWTLKQLTQLQLCSLTPSTMEDHAAVFWVKVILVLNAILRYGHLKFFSLDTKSTP